MTALYSPGFLTAESDRVVRTSTTILCRGVEQSGLVLVDWDYSADVVVEVDLTVDLEGLKNDLSVEGRLLTMGALHWSATGSGLRGAGEPVTLEDGVNTIRLELDGAKLGGALVISARVVFKGAEHYGGMSPRRPGSTVWSEQFTLTLEGEGNRFPTLPVPFSSSGLAGGTNAAWALDISTTDLDVSASSAVTLYLNSEHPRIAELLSGESGPFAETILRFIEYDVTRQLMQAALGAADLDEEDAYGPGTLGEALSNLIKRLFPARTLTEIRSAAATAPGELEAELQAVLDLPLRATP